MPLVLPARSRPGCASSRQPRTANGRLKAWQQPSPACPPQVAASASLELSDLTAVGPLDGRYGSKVRVPSWQAYS